MPYSRSNSCVKTTFFVPGAAVVVVVVVVAVVFAVGDVAAHGWMRRE